MVRRRIRLPAGVLSAALMAAVGVSACQRAVRLPVTATVPQEAAAAREEVDPATLDRKVMFGYQGWFGCPGDGSPVGAWQHWFARGAAATPDSLRIDMWPDTSELTPGEQCATPLTLPGGRPAVLYSAFNPKTVDRHFRWMRDYGLAGVFLQRFTSELRAASSRDFRDGVAANVRAGAEHHGRVFAIMYDISGHPPETLVEDVERDWIHLVDDLRVTESPRYLQHRGRPLLAIWGLGFRDRPASPGQAAALIEFFHENPDPRYRATLMGGVPARWRTLTSDSRGDPAWARVYRSLDVISPWLVGRFRDSRTIDRYYKDVVGPDLAAARAAGLDYVPVLFPGFSWHHLRADSPLNRIPRLGGRFYWRQVDRALQAGATMFYGAMFDELDEGTAMFKIAPSAAAAPDEVPTVTLDSDGEALPSDWYLRLAGEAQKRLDATSDRRRQAPAGPPAAGPESCASPCR